MTTPDVAANGLLAEKPPALRYGNNTDLDPYEVPGIMRMMVPSRVRVLDIGSGSGETCLAINLGKENVVVCVEPDPDRAAAARENGLDICESYFDSALAAKLGKFDVVILGDILEHLSNPATLLEDLKLSLKPTSIILASVPNVAHWTIRLKLLAGRFDYAETGLMDATHLRWFTRESLHRLFEMAGYRIQRVGATAGYWLPAYNSRRARLIPGVVRRQLVITGLRLLPKLVGCQHIVSVTPRV